MNDPIVSKNPRTGEEVGRVDPTPPDEVRAAVTLARKAFTEWSALSHSERQPYLKALKTTLLHNADRIAELVAAETGKQPVDVLTTEVAVSGAMADYVVRRAHKVLAPERRSARPFVGTKAWVEYNPRGVAGVISPWNYPFSLPFNPTLAALAAGCTVVVKPSEVTPLSGALVGELTREAGLPTGVVQVVQGGPQVGSALVRESDVLSFIGSPKTARLVAAEGAASLTPIIFELGGKDAMIVLEDADLGRAARAAVWGGLVNAGQTCISVERVYAVDAIYDQFLARVRSEMERMTVGTGDRFDIGPISFGPQMGIISRHVEDALAKGARALTGGSQEGPYYPATLLVDVDHTMEVMRDETFGPVVPVMRVPSEEAAIELANDSNFGLHGSVWTKDPERGRRVASRMRTGTVAINNALVNYGVPDLPFGGIDQSGYGSVSGPEGLRGFCYPKAITESRLPFRKELWWFPRRGGQRFWRGFVRTMSRG